jgi:hypothetical protein
MTYWKATVERPDGAGDWQLVGVFGTDAYPTSGTGRHLHGDTALDAAKLLLSHVWPIDIAEPGRYDRPNRWSLDKEAKTGVADHRITVELSDRPYNLPYGTKVPPEGLVITVAELRLLDLRDLVAAQVKAQATAAELAKQAQTARAEARHAKWRVEEAIREAALAGVDPDQITKAKRVPRRKKT